MKSHLKVFADNNPNEALHDTDDRKLITSLLKDAGVRFLYWEPTVKLQPGDSQEKVISAYQQDIDELIAEEGYQTVDVVSLNPDHPQKAEMRQKFLFEHTHSEDEVRFFVEGRGMFSMHIDGKVYECTCVKGDLISVPDGFKHWFDMGPEPEFIAIRLFNNPEGWVAEATGSNIADSFSRLE